MKRNSSGPLRNRAAGVLCAAAFISIVLASCKDPLPTAELTVNGKPLTVELATTPAERELGLMNRKSMTEDHGMLFIFPRDEQLTFWMKNTSIPLSIAFMSEDGTVKTIRDMQPFSLDSIGSVYSVRYALEVNQGYFALHDVSVGDRIRLPNDLPAASQ